MALAPFRRERAVKKILLVKALPLRVVLLYRTAGWNARLFRKSLCKRLCKSLKTLSSAGGRPFRRSSGAPLEARFTPSEGVGSGRLRRPGDAVPTAGAKGDVGHLRFPMSPLDTPLTFRWPLSEAFAAKRGLRGLGSVRRFAYGTLSGLEFTLRDLPRITVRGQTVQGGSVPLRKAPLRSRGVPWSTERPCGPLAFRRATEGSRVQRKMRGSQEGDALI